MIILKYPQLDPKLSDIQERLNNLSLAYQAQLDINTPSMTLESSGTIYVGSEDINEYIDLLAAEAGKWWYCDC